MRRRPPGRGSRGARPLSGVPVIALVGLLLAHVLGATLRHLTTRCGWGPALRSPSSAWFAITLAFVISLGPPGLVLLLALAITTTQTARGAPRPLPRWAWAALALLTVLVLARPWVPTQWDEFVWLGKARLEGLGFGATARASLDPAQRLIPPGYPVLWPEAVGWLSLGQDLLEAQLLAGSLLVLLSAAAALEAFAPERFSWGALGVLVAAPLIWVHARSTYVDLPVGLLGLALLGQLLKNPERPPLLAAVLALALAGLKDEGLFQVLAASGAVLLVRGPRRWRLLLPAALTGLAVVLWRALVHLAGVPLFDHTLGAPQWDFAPRLLSLFALHGSDVFSWGVFWAVAGAALLLPLADPPARAARAMLLLLVLCFFGALLAGPERVRVFAENGSLLNRLLVQLWPVGAALVLFGFAPPAPLTDRGA